MNGVAGNIARKKFSQCRPKSLFHLENFLVATVEHVSSLSYKICAHALIRLSSGCFHNVAIPRAIAFRA